MPTVSKPFVWYVRARIKQGMHSRWLCGVWGGWRGGVGAHLVDAVGIEEVEIDDERLGGGGDDGA